MSAGAARVHRQQRRLAAEAGRGRGALTLLEVEHVARRCVDGHAGIALRAQRPHAALLLGAVDHGRAAAGHRDETGLARGGRAEGRAVEVGDDGVVVDALVAAGAGPAEVVRRVGLELVVVDCAQKRWRLTHDAHRNGAARKKRAGRGGRGGAHCGGTCAPSTSCPRRSCRRWSGTVPSTEAAGRLRSGASGRPGAAPAGSSCWYPWERAAR